MNSTTSEAAAQYNSAIHCFLVIVYRENYCAIYHISKSHTYFEKATYTTGAHYWLKKSPKVRWSHEKRWLQVFQTNKCIRGIRGKSLLVVFQTGSKLWDSLWRPGGAFYRGAAGATGASFDKIRTVSRTVQARTGKPADLWLLEEGNYEGIMIFRIVHPGPFWRRLTWSRVATLFFDTRIGDSSFDIKRRGGKSAFCNWNQARE